MAEPAPAMPESDCGCAAAGPAGFSLGDMGQTVEMADAVDMGQTVKWPTQAVAIAAAEQQSQF